MVDPTLIAAQIVAVFLGTVFLGYVVWRHGSRRAGVALTTAGFFDGLILIVNYFEGVPSIIVFGGLIAFFATVLFALVEGIWSGRIYKPEQD